MHFTVFVGIDPHTNRLTMSQQVEDALAPFDENATVVPHEVECWQCSEMNRLRRGRRMANLLHGDYDDARDEFYRQYPLWEHLDWFNRSPEKDDQFRGEWTQFFYERNLTERDYAENHPNPIDPHCSVCGGTGKEITTDNPQGKWDWWSIGGRWHGALGTPDDRLKGKDVPDTFIPHAILTPNGIWHERSALGWHVVIWGTVPSVIWGRRIQVLLSEWPEHTFVLVDCHS